MAQKSGKISQIVNIVVALLSLVALITLFMPAIAGKEGDGSYNFLKVIFGHTEKNQYMEAKVLDFSVGALITFILVIVALVLSALRLLKSGFDSPMYTFILAGVLLVAGIFFFLTVNFTNPHTELVKPEVIRDSLKLGAGAIVGGVCCLCGAVGSLVPIVLKDK